MPEVPELHLAAARERKHVKPDEPETLETMTAFLVVITPQGQVMVLPEIPDKITTEHPPTEAEIETACNSITDNMKITRQAQITAQLVMQAMMQAGQQMQNQSINKKMLDELRTRPPR